MKPYTRNMNQVATYWPPGANDGFGGVSYGAPVSIKCRWQDKRDLIRDTEGQEVTSSAVVYVDRVLEPKGYLFEGASAEANPFNVAQARQVLQKGSSPALSANEVLLKVWL